MSYQQGSAISVAAVVTVATVIITAYRLSHSDVNTTHRAERTGRREVFSHTVQFVTSAVVIFGMLFVVAYHWAR